MKRIALLAGVMLLAVAGLVYAANQIPRFVIGGGGLGTVGATHSIRSTLGQDVIGKFAFGTHAIKAGFWYPGAATTGIEEPAAVIPSAFQIYQNVPNPFNPMTAIRYDVPAAGGRVTLKVYDTSGRLVRTLVDREETPGTKQVQWDGRDDQRQRLASGIYLYAFEAKDFRKTRKLVILQ